MKFFRVIYFLLLLLIALFFPGQVNASQEINCPNRFLTLVNPVRSRDLWKDHSLKPLTDQFDVISKKGFSATWLLTYDVLLDAELVGKINTFNGKREIGLFLEVSRRLANDAVVFQNLYSRWSSPDVVFLSAYEQSERKRIIDTVFRKYKQIFGAYPKSVGGWWIDSYSLEYLTRKYGIKSVIIVADQKVTDDYGVWGGWWGYPYYPSEENILVPRKEKVTEDDPVVIQWAQRHPTLAYGGKGEYSLYSMQANDYVRVRRNISFFKDLISIYLDCRNLLGQIAVGLETGMESIEAFPEYKKQLDYLSSLKNLNVVTMSEFADSFHRSYQSNPEVIFLGDSGKNWELTTEFRKNESLGEEIFYQEIFFGDYFVRDDSKFLNRNLEELFKKADRSIPRKSKPVVFLVLILGTLLVRRSFFAWFAGTLFLIASYGRLLFSKYQDGWQVFYGPVVPNLATYSILVVLISYVIFYLLYRYLQKRKAEKMHLLLFLFSLSYSLDYLVSILRYSYINNYWYFGIFWKLKHFFGVSLSDNYHFNFISKDFPATEALAFIKYDFNYIWNNPVGALVGYPLIHILVGLVGWLIIRRLPRRVRIIVLTAITIFYVLYLIFLFKTDPRVILPT